MSAPERIWAVTEPDDISAQIMGAVYAQQVPDGMVGEPVEYVRADIPASRIAELEAENARLRDGIVTLVFNNADATPKSTVLRVQRDAVASIMDWYEAFHAGDRYTVTMDGRNVPMDINGGMAKGRTP